LANQQSYSVSTPVSTEMLDHSQPAPGQLSLLFSAEWKLSTG